MSEDRQKLKRLVETITDPSLRREFADLITRTLDLDDSMALEATNVEFRLTCGDAFVCRLAPYDELFHAQVGENPAWETRVRTPKGAREALDRIIQRYLDSVADRAKDGAGAR